MGSKTSARACSAAVALLAAAPFLAPACRTTLPPPPQVPPLASNALAEAREAFARASDARVRALEGVSDGPGAAPGSSIAPGSPGSDRAFAEEEALLARARAAAREALEHAPDWIAPQRLLDDLDRDALLATATLARHRRALEARPEDPALLYLTGRLEGAAGAERFARAARFAPELAWPQHGLAWSAFSAGDPAAALGPGRRALERARDPWERAYFAMALARYLDVLDRGERARELLAEAAAGELAPWDRLELEAFRARGELAAADPGVVETGIERGLRLVGEPRLGGTLLAGLAADLVASTARFGEAELAAALEVELARRGDALGRALRAHLLLRRGAPSLALALTEAGDGERSPSIAVGPDGRAARFAVGEAPAAVEDWLAELPRVVCAADGLPAEPRLRAVVECARALGAGEDGAGGNGADERAASIALGEALLAAGWFAEARGLAGALAPLDAVAAAELDRRSSAGRALLEGLARTLDRVDAGAPFPAAWAPIEPRPAPDFEPDPRPVRSLRQLLAVVEGLFERYHRSLGAEIDLDLVSSPRLDYGPFARLVHPGPTYSAADEEAGRGKAGEPVGGLAAELAALGRFSEASVQYQRLARAHPGVIKYRSALEELIEKHARPKSRP